MATLRDAIEATSTMDIVEYFEIPYKQKRDKVYLLCPGHDDHNFGSCYIDKDDDGYYCYVCSQHVTKWEMVVDQYNGDKSAARKWFFSHTGLTPQKVQNTNDLAIKKIINQMKNVLKSASVFNDIGVCEKNMSPYGRSVYPGEYLISTLITSNPLMDIYKCNPIAFKNIGIVMLREEIKRIDRCIMAIQKNKKQYFVNSVGLISNDIFIPEMEARKTAIAEIIQQIQDL